MHIDKACGAEHPDEDERMSGSTATMLLARRDRVVVANVGDSRAVLCRGGKPIALSAEHRCFSQVHIASLPVLRPQAEGVSPGSARGLSTTLLQAR